MIFLCSHEDVIKGLGNCQWAVSKEEKRGPKDEKKGVQKKVDRWRSERSLGTFFNIWKKGGNHQVGSFGRGSEGKHWGNRGGGGSCL